MNTLDVLKKLLTLNSDISYIHLIPIGESVFVQSAIEESSKDNLQIISALKIREKYKFSFWDSLCSVFIDNENYSKDLLKKVIHHNTNSEILTLHSLNFINDNYLIDSSRQYAISSTVTMKDGRICHIPLIDFHCKLSNTNRNLVIDVIRELDVGWGMLLDSGNSYHFIGMRLIEEWMLGSFIGKLIMFNPIIDKSWSAHQLIEGYCALRFTKKHGKRPAVICEVR